MLFVGLPALLVAIAAALVFAGFVHGQFVAREQGALREGEVFMRGRDFGRSLERDLRDQYIAQVEEQCERAIQRAQTDAIMSLKVRDSLCSRCGEFRGGVGHMLGGGGEIV